MRLFADSVTYFTFAVLFRWEGAFIAFLDQFQSIRRASEIKKNYFRQFFDGQIIFYQFYMKTYPMGNKPPPIQKLTNNEISIKSIFPLARFSFLLQGP